jgi:hypothetical protein
MSFAITMLSKRALLLGKVESDYGTDPTPAKTTDVMYAYDINISPDIEAEKRPDRVASFEALGTVVGRQTHDFSFKTISVGGNTVVAPIESPLLSMCGFVVGFDLGTGITTATLSSSQPAALSSASLYFYIDGGLYKLIGSRGNLVIRAVNGKALELEFKGKGLYDTPSTSAFITDPTISALNPLICTGLTATIGTLALEGIESIELDLGTEITVSHSIGETTGVREINRVNRNITLKLNPEITPAQLATIETALIDMTTEAVIINLASGDYGMQITCANCEILSAPNSERDGKIIKDITMAVNDNASVGNALRIEYSPAA